MKEILKQLLKTQLGVSVFLIFVVAILPGHSVRVVSVFVGCGLALLMTLATYSIFRRLPELIPAKKFYLIMIITNLLKWFVILTLGTVAIAFFRVNNVAPAGAGIVIGFSLTYLSCFRIILKG